MQNDFNYREPVQKILQDLHISMDFGQLKSGPGITRSDLLVINKIDLAPYVGADLSVMKRDTKRMREARPFVFTNLKDGTGFTAVVDWLRGHL